MSGETINFEALIQSAKEQKAQNVTIAKLDSLLNYQILSPFEVKFVNSIKEKLETNFKLSDKQKSALAKILLKCDEAKIK